MILPAVNDRLTESQYAGPVPKLGADALPQRMRTIDVFASSSEAELVLVFDAQYFADILLVFAHMGPDPTAVNLLDMAAFTALGRVRKHTDQSPSGCCGGMCLESGEKETENALARSRYHLSTSESAHGTAEDYSMSP